MALLAFVTGALATRLVWLGSRDLLVSGALARTNYRGRVIPTAAGLLAAFAVIAVEAARSALGALGLGDQTGLTQSRSLMLVAVIGFALLGFTDDVLGTDEARGYRGHIAALFRGRLTTGFVKLAGGGALAILLVATPGFRSGARLIVDAALIALAANFANLLDRAPGRTLKVGLVLTAPLLIALGLGSSVAVAVALPVGACVGLIFDDLAERCMIGDTGANVIGAALGLGVVLGTSFTVRVVTMLALLALNLAAEIISYGTVIERATWLRRVDEMGRRSSGPSPR